MRKMWTVSEGASEVLIPAYGVLPAIFVGAFLLY